MIDIKDMVIPEVKLLREANNYAKFSVFPLERGYGTTIGNSLRRVLLSSLEGCAITDIKIEGIKHEFSAIPGIREDVLRVVLQLKQLRLIIHDADTAVLTLHKKGAGIVTAADIRSEDNVEIINKDLYLFEVDNPSAEIKIEMNAQKGRGYIPANERHEPVGIGDIPIDAIFSPIVRINWDVNQALYNDRANYDRLEMEIWTDGTTKPETALRNAVKILINHLRYVLGIDEELPELPVAKDKAKQEKTDPLDVSISVLELPVRVHKALERSGFRTIRETLYLLEHEADATVMVKNFGKKGFMELKSKLIENNYWKEKDKND